MKTVPVTKQVEITDKMRVDWLCHRVSYLEHSGVGGITCAQVKKGGYWPQNEGSDNSIPELIDLQLDDYIDEMIRLELQEAA